MNGFEQQEPTGEKPRIGEQLREAWQEVQQSWLALPGGSILQAADVLSRAIRNRLDGNPPPTDGSAPGGVQ